MDKNKNIIKLVCTKSGILKNNQGVHS